MASCSLNLNLVLIFLLSFSSLWTCPAARDTLKPGDTLNSSSTLVSANGQFTLVFKVSDDTSNSSYLVIKWAGINNWAWVANPYTPILYPLGILTLDTNHTLKITHKGGDPVLLYSAPEAANSAVVATLLDSGNFVLREVNSDDGSTKKVLWQSFDYPGDTLLPGMKLGVNHRNGHIWSLSSWFTPISAVPGAFALDWDPGEHQLKIRRYGVVYWSSGVFRDGRFEFIDESMYNFSVVSNENEDYFTYTSAEKSEWLLSIFGRLFEFGSKHVIAQADNCYGHNTDGGCQRWEDQPIGCRDFTGERFEQEKGYFNPITSRSSNINSTTTSDSNTSLGLSDCKAACWRNCDCFGFNSLLDNQTGCKFWIGNWEFVQDRSGYSSTSPYFLAKSSSKARSSKKWIWIGTAIAAALLLCIVCFLLIRRRNFVLSGQNGTKIQELLNLMKYNRPIDVNGIQNDGNMGHHNLSVFSYASVLAATCNFSMENRLGEGGFGTVYKGKLVTGQEIAVKRLSKCSGQGALEFKNELILIYELQHTNLVRLFGFCIHDEERMLIYEYMPNRSLDHFIFDSTKGQLLDWKKRFSIIEGIAQGLLYLHKYSRMTVIHRDLKASNILLDESMNPKISDFGMARIFTPNEQEGNTNTVVGTYGYMSPEYMMGGFFSIKSDVYSFGVLMLEIISGRKNSSFYNVYGVRHLVGHAWELWKEGAWLELMDPTLGDSCNGDQLLRCIHVGLLCVEENAARRPTMLDVIPMLTNESMALPMPTKPAFCTERNAVTTGVSGMTSESKSLYDDMSYSDFGGR